MSKIAHLAMFRLIASTHEQFGPVFPGLIRETRQVYIFCGAETHASGGKGGAKRLL